ncbi:cytochrome P450 [Micromonospora zamorensis]|uniref:cytochrome P450 n=1 Tax=Micromonospora zamorensis TaxID=709883 RepID=UPI0038635D16|nr:cytochrome P450 [Micromonospora zamorensis]
MTSATQHPAPAGSGTGEPAPLPRQRGKCPFSPPDELLQRAEEHPVSPLIMADGSVGWLVTRAEDVRAVLADNRFSADILKASNPIQVIPEEAKQLPPDPAFFIHVDPPHHTRYRKMLMGQFTMRRVRALEPRIAEIVTERLDAIEAAGAPADLVRDFALPIPSLVICELLGVPYAERAQFQTLTAAMLRTDATPMEIGMSAWNLRQYLAALVATKHDEPDGALISGLIHDSDDDPLTDEELTSIAMLLLVGGHETTANQLSLGVFALLSNPEQLAVLRADLDRVPDAVEELLRYLPTFQFGVTRLATEDVPVGGQLIRAGESVSLSLSAANRDPSRYADPGVLDVTRTGLQHLAFGHGVHLCIGQQLARAELRIALRALFTRFPGLRLHGSIEDVPLRSESLIYGVRELPITW